MAQIIEVISVELDGPRKEARRLESIIGQEKVEAFVIPTAVVREILISWGVTKLPVFRIEGVTVWEGESPSRDLIREWLHWPKSLDEAVGRLLSADNEIPEEPSAYFELGTAIMNSFGLLGTNKALLRSCGSESMSADDASAVILKKAREVQNSRKGK